MRGYEHSMFKACANVSELHSMDIGKVNINAEYFIITPCLDAKVYTVEDTIPENFYHRTFESKWDDSGI